MFTGMLMVAVSALLFVVIIVLRARFGTRLRRVWALLLAIVAAGSVAAPIAIRGRGVPAAPKTRPVDAIKDVAAVGDVTAERSSRVTILAIDAASLELITNATADGRLPNFGRLLDAGAVMHLATLHPTSAEAVWAAAATGKLPQKNGVRSLGTYRLARTSTVLGRPRTAAARGGETVQLMPEYCYANALMRFGLFVEEPHTSATFRARPFWSILGALNIPVAVAGWPLTQPAPAVLGYLVSDAYPRRVGTSGD
jgi:hypothetical protein